MSNKPLFFSHDCEAKNDIKMIELRSKFEWESYGIFWAIIEDLCKMPKYEMEKSRLSLLAFTYNLDITYLENIYNECVKLELLTEKNNIFYSKSLKIRMENLDEKRNKQSNGGRKGMANRYKKQPIKATNLVISNLQDSYKLEPNLVITVKDSIVEESIVKNSKEIINTEFENFFNYYDKKRGKPKTFELFKKLNSEERALIRIHLPKYKANTEKEFRKDPERYLKHKAWLDEVIEKNKKEEESEGTQISDEVLSSLDKRITANLPINRLNNGN